MYYMIIVKKQKNWKKGINEIEEIELNCKLCENYKEEIIDIFELLKMKEEKNNEVENNKELGNNE